MTGSEDAPQDWKGFLRRWLLIAAALHVVAALFSAGFYHSDEHFQILEFVSYKLGWARPEALPIEFSQAMRPWLQPALYYGVVRTLGSLGISDPFVWATAIRLLSALVGFLSLASLARACERWFPDLRWRARAVRCLALLWFIPALHARHSSENLGGALFFLGLGALLAALPRAAGGSAAAPRLASAAGSPDSAPHSEPGAPPLRGFVWAGFALGLAFEVRYQTAFLTAGALLWAVFVARIRARPLARLALGAMAALALGALADRWGYGHWALTPWNYFRFNLLENHVNEMDVSPWWDYFRRATTEAWPLLGTLTLAAFPIAWLRNPRHPLTWATVPFFLVHVLIGHKELRFLFPMAHAAPVFLILALHPAGTRAAPAALDRPLRWSWKFLAALNLTGLLALTLVPAWMPIRFYSHLYHEMTSNGRAPFVLRFVGASPYDVPIELSFYRPRSLRLLGSPDFASLARELRGGRGAHWVFGTRSRLPDEASDLAGACTAEFSVLPAWLRLFDRVSNWTLYRCEPPPAD